MSEEDKDYPFVVVANLIRSGTVKEVQVRVFDPADTGPLPLPISEGAAPAYGDDALATAMYRAFADLAIPPREEKPTPEIDDLIRAIEENANA